MSGMVDWVNDDTPDFCHKQGIPIDYKWDRTNISIGPYERIAKKASKKSTHNRFYHAAIVTKGGAILAVGYNRNHIHAEVHALKQLWPNKRKGTTVVSLRFTKESGMGNSKPCKKCMKFMKAAGVSKIEYAVVSPGWVTKPDLPGIWKIRFPRHVRIIREKI